MAKSLVNTLSLSINTRCRRCLRVLGDDGKCHNHKCPLCVDKESEEKTED